MTGTSPPALAPTEPARPPGPRLPLPVAMRFALAAGMGTALAFAPYDVWVLAVAGVAAFTLLLRGRRPGAGALLGLAFGLGLYAVMLHWVSVIGPDAWLGLTLVCAGFLAAQGAATTVVLRLPGWPLWTAALWVAQEAVRSRLPYGGFPWGRLAFAETGAPLVRWAAWGGAPLVTFATALAGTLLAAAVVAVATRGVRAGAGRALGALAGVVAVALLAFAVPVPTAPGPEGTTTAAVVQGNVPQPGLDFLGRPEQVLQNHVAETRRLAAEVEAGRAPAPDLVIWPENASDVDPYERADAAQDISGAVDDIDAPTLVGAVVETRDGEHLRNLGIVWNPGTGPGEVYQKRHPVPWGEYVPHRKLLSRFISRLDRVPRDFVAGNTVGTLQVGPAVVGDVICFEIAYDGLVRDNLVRPAGGVPAQLLAVQTNNATYAGTGLSEQQLAMSRLRAIEHGRAVLVAATSGISAVIAPDGTVQARTRELEAASLVRDVPLRDALTPADRVGALPEWLLVAAALGAVVGPAAARRRRARP